MLTIGGGGGASGGEGGPRVYFVDTFWPEFGTREMARVLLSWQREVWWDRWRRMGRSAKARATEKVRTS
jgi:hypothetical protein